MIVVVELMGELMKDTSVQSTLGSTAYGIGMQAARQLGSSAKKRVLGQDRSRKIGPTTIKYNPQKHASAH